MSRSEDGELTDFLFVSNLPKDELDALLGENGAPDSRLYDQNADFVKGALHDDLGVPFPSVWQKLTEGWHLRKPPRTQENRRQSGVDSRLRPAISHLESYP